MGAGSFASGLGPSGFDPIEIGVSVDPVTPQALRYEGGTTDWIILEDGNFDGVHWVEQAFALGCLVPKGSLKSSPDVGNTVQEIRYLGGVDIAAELDDRIRNANPIKTLLANGQAELVRIDHAVMPGGGLKYAVYFRNLLTPSAPKKGVRRSV